MFTYRRFVLVLAVAGFVNLARGELPSSIDLTYVDDSPDTMFDGSSFTMVQQATAPSTLVLTDPAAVPAILSGFSPVSFDLNSSFQSVIYDGVIPLQRFVGGVVSLTFEDSAGDYYLEAQIQSLIVRPPQPALGYSIVDIEATFMVSQASLHLPGDREWDAEGSVSLLNSLSIRIDQDISALDWPSRTPWGGNTISSFTLDEFMSTLLDPETPEPPPWWSIPEPASASSASVVVLYAALSRRRRSG